MREPSLRNFAETHLMDNRLSVTWFVSFTVECFLQTELVNDSYLDLKIDDSTGLRWIQGSLPSCLGSLAIRIRDEYKSRNICWQTS